MRISRIASIATAGFAAALLATAPAFADISGGGGGFVGNGNGLSTSGAAVFLSTDKAVPVLPASVGLTGFAPLARGGGYAVTVDGRFAALGNAFGVGYGIGRFGGARAGGTFTAFFDHSIAPLTSLELRGYQTTGANSATAGFLGVRFSI